MDTPVQVKVIPITDKQADYAQKIKETLQQQNIRVELDDKAETMQNKSAMLPVKKFPI
jgi:threonyl-tRNA synthetase